MLTVFVTCPSKKEAEKLAVTAVKERLAACVNVFPLASVYYWNKKLVRGREYALLLKTTEKRYAQLEHRLKQLHSAQVPCIVAWKDEKAHVPYAAWVAKSVHSASEFLPMV